MLSIAGQLSLILLILCSLILGVTSLAGRLRISRILSFTIALLGVVCFGSLMFGYIISDFSILNVAQNSHTLKPMLYKVTGTWGNHEGSMLLFLFLLGLCTAALTLIAGSHYAIALLPQSILMAGLGLFILLTSNPFMTLNPAPRQGMGLNPLLQDIGLAFHPPILYAGYMGLSLAFSLTIAILLNKTPKNTWPQLLLPCTLIPWGFLTAGIALGSWWAYRELGWGGFWFWDPVENASLMPWLLSTALIHTLILAQKRKAMTRLSLLLAILSFAMSLYGTFLVRSGILTSVHSFASSPERGLFILGFITLILGASLTLYTLRIKQIPDNFTGSFWSRDMSMALHAVCLITACLVVVLATLYPIVYESLSGITVGVGTPYFSLTFVPIAALTVVLAGIGPMIAWNRQPFLTWAKRVIPTFICAVMFALTSLILMGDAPMSTILFLTCGWWLILSTLQTAAIRFDFHSLSINNIWSQMRTVSGHYYAMIVGHLGLGLLVIAITTAVTWSHEYFGYVSPGTSLTLNDFKITLQSIDYVPGPNYISQKGVYNLQRSNKTLGPLVAERRYYPVENNSTTEAALHSTIFYDLYLALGTNPQQNIYQTRIYYKPAMNFIWIGALCITLAGFISFVPRKKKVDVAPISRKED